MGIYNGHQGRAQQIFHYGLNNDRPDITELPYNIYTDASMDVVAPAYITTHGKITQWYATHIGSFSCPPPPLTSASAHATEQTPR